MGAPRKEFCKRGHPLKDALVTVTPKGIKRECRKCRYIRHTKYIQVGAYRNNSL